MANQNVDFERLLEKQLRETACNGNTAVVKQLLKETLDVDVNTRDTDTGWTPLHFACKSGNADIAALLLKKGANKNAKSKNGETPSSVCTNQQILQLLGVPMDSQRGSNEPAVHCVKPKYLKNDYAQVDSGLTSKLRNNSLHQDELVLKIRIADGADPDFIEIELPQNDLTYQALIRICCQELSLDPSQVVKLRKLPNTKLRKDEDIKRLLNFQEIEVVTNTTGMFRYSQNSNGIPNNTPIMPANGYQSISKKDQTILY